MKEEVNVGELVTNTINGKDAIVTLKGSFQNAKGELTKYYHVRYLEDKISMVNVENTKKREKENGY